MKIQKIKRVRNTERNGEFMIVELPCAVNDRVYCIENNEIVVRDVVCFMVGQLGTTACLVNRKLKEKTFDAALDRFGKTIFLCRTEAQRTLIER